VTFLIDENLSRRLKRLLEPSFPGCRHVSDFGLLTADDPVIHACARSEGLTLLSKDDDFRNLVERVGPPPKLILIRMGNAPTLAIAEAVLARSMDIADFLSASLGVLEIATD